MARRKSYNSDYNKDKGMYSKSEYERKYSQGTAGNAGYSMADFVQRYNTGIYDEYRQQLAMDEEQRRLEKQRQENMARTQAWQDAHRNAVYSPNGDAGHLVYAEKMKYDTMGQEAYLQDVKRRQEEARQAQLKYDTYMKQQFPRLEIQAEKAWQRNYARDQQAKQEAQAQYHLTHDFMRDLKAANGGNGTAAPLTIAEFQAGRKVQKADQEKGLLDKGTNPWDVSEAGLPDWIKRNQKAADEYSATPGQLWADVRRYADEREADRLQRSKPAEYEGNREEYDEELYDNFNGKGAYAKRVDEIETDEDADALDRELDELWGRYERGELPLFESSYYKGDETEKRIAELTGDLDSNWEKNRDAGDRYFDFGTDYVDWANLTPEQRRETLWMEMMGTEYAAAQEGMTDAEKAEMNRRMDLITNKAMQGKTKDFNGAANAYSQLVKQGEAAQEYWKNLAQYGTQAEELIAQGYTGEGIPAMLEENKPRYVVADPDDPEGMLTWNRTWSDTEKAMYQMNYRKNLDGSGDLYSDTTKYMLADDDQIRQANIFYEYDQKNGTHMTEAFLEGIDSYLTNELVKYQEEYARSLADQPVQGTVARIASYPGKIVTGIAGAIGTVAAFFGDENAKDTTSDYYKYDKLINVLRDQGNENAADWVADTFGEGWRDKTKFALGVVDSIADNLMAMAVGSKLAGVSAATRTEQNVKRSMRLVQLIMSAEATSSTMIEKLESGMDGTEAAVYSVGNGIIEWLTEKYSLEQIMGPDVKQLLGKGKDLASFLIRSAAAEGSEEIASDLLNIGLDSVVSWINGHENEIQQRVNEYITQQGMTAREAEKRVLQEKLGEIAQSGLAGALSGIGMAGGRVVGTKISQHTSGHNIAENGGMQKILDLASGMKEGTESRALADELNSRKGKPTSTQLGRLAQTIVMESGEERAQVIRETVQRNITEELKDAGVKNAKEAAEVITRNLMDGNQKLNREDRAVLAQDENSINKWQEYNKKDNLTVNTMKTNLEVQQNTQGVNSVIETVSDLTSDSRKSAGALAEEINRSVKETKSAAEAIDNFQQRRGGLMSESYAQLAKDLLESDKSTQKSKNYLDDVMKIRMAAMTLNRNMPRTSLETGAAQALFNAAREEFNEADRARLKNQVKVIPGQGTATFEDGAKYGTAEWTKHLEGLNTEQKQQVKALAEITQRLGNRMVMHNDTERTGVYGFEEESGTIHINIAGMNRNGLNHHMLTTMSHELTHWLEQNSWNGYNQLRSFVLESLRSKGVSIEDRIMHAITSQNAALGAESGHDLDIVGAMKEIVAQSCENLLSSRAFEEELRRSNPELHGKIRNFVRKFIARLRTAVQGMTGSLHSNARTLLNETEKIAELWLGARQEALRRTATGPLAEAGTEGVSFSTAEDIQQRYAGEALYKDASVYDYDFLVSLPDITVNVEGDIREIENTDGIVDRKKLAIIGERNTYEKADAVKHGDFATVKNSYTGRNIGITRDSYTHGTHTNDKNKDRANARVGMIAGQLAKNAVPINGLKNKKNIAGTYAMAAPVRSANGKFAKIAILTVEIRSGNLIDIEVTDQLHAVSARKKNGVGKDRANAQAGLSADNALTVFTRSKISIAELLEYVNSTHRSILSQDVLNHFNKERSEDGYWANKVLFSTAEDQEEGNKKGSLPALADRQGPASTSETNNGSLASEDIISDYEKHVNRRKAERNKVDDLDREYLEAIERGDEKKYLRMIRDKYDKTEGIYPFYAPERYAGEENIRITKEIKEGNMEAIAKAAAKMAKFVPDKAVLIPMPGHTGVVTEGSDTMLLAKELSRITGAQVINALEGNERESRFKSSNRNKITAEVMGLRQIKELPAGYIPMIIDNVVSKGETAKAAIDAIPGSSVLSFTKGTSESVTEGLKAAYPTKDKQGNWIPLSKKGDIDNPNWRWSTMESPDMEVNNFMMGLQEFNMNSAQEKTMLRQYKDLHMSMGITQMKIRDYEAQLRKLRAKDKLSVYDRDQIRILNNRLDVNRDRMNRLRQELVRATKDKGYARQMMKNDALMKNLVSGVTADQLISIVQDMSRQLEDLNRDMQTRAEKLQELGQSSAVLQIRQQFNRQGLKRIAAQLKADMNSELSNKDIENRLAMIALKMKEGKFDQETTQELTDMILGKMRGGFDTYVLSSLRGEKIALSPAQLKELKATNSSLRELNAELAGTGIRFVEKGGTNLEQKWAEYCGMFTSLDENTRNLDQVDALMNLIRSERNTVFEERFNNENVQGTTEAVLKAAAELVPEIVTDAKSMNLIRETLQFVQEISGQAGENAEAISDIGKAVARIRQTGEAAASGANKLTGDIQTALSYFNDLSEQSEAAMWKRERLALIDQLKSENTQNLLAEQEKWRQKIEKDKAAREKMQSNMQLRKRIDTNTNRIRKLLVNETDLRNIPEHMKGLAREMLGLIVDNDLTGRKITGMDPKDLMDTRRVLDAMKELDGEFTPDDLRLINDEEAQAAVMEALADIEDGIGFYNNKLGKDMMANLQGFHNALERISDGVSTITSVISAERSLSFLDRRMDLADAAEDIRRDMGRSRFKGELAGRGAKAVDAARSAVFYGNMTPVYYFKMLRNAGLDMVWEDVQQGENRSGLETQKAKAFLQNLAEKTDYKSWAEEKHDILLGGKKTTVSIENMMELYAIWKREQTTNPEMSQHLSKGGVFIQDEAEDRSVLHREQKTQKAVRVTDEEIQAMYGQMTEAQKEYLDSIVKYLSNDMSDLGNEASMRMYGIKKYKETWYFPMKVWDGVKSARSDKGITGTDENRAAHRSWSKRRMHMAQNALVIGNFTRDAVNHIVEMINYNTMAPGIENINKILNFQFTEGETEDDMTKRNMRIMFQETYGREALKYLETFMKDMNGGVAQDQRRTLRDKALTMFKKNAVAGSLSVALQQPLSYIRAAMIISPKYLAQALSPVYWKGSYNEMMEHSGVAVIKNMGRFDMNFGQSAKDFITPETRTNLYEKVSDALTAAPEMMDRMTWTRMWSAVKAEQAALHPEMDVKSDQFLDMAGRRFNQVMRETQVYDSILVKSSNMRSQNFGMKLITSFMAEPTLSLNVLADAVGRVRAGDKGAVTHMAKAGATFLLSAIMQAVVKGLMGSGRTPDDKKTWLENFLNKLQYNLMNEANPISMIPGYSDLIEVLKTGELKDDAMGAIGKLTSIVQTIQKAAQGNGKGWYRDIEDTAGQLAQLFTNIPAKNLMRDARAIRNWIVGDTYANRPTNRSIIRYQAEANLFTADNLLGTLNTWLGDAGFKTSNKAYYSRMYEAEKSGNQSEADSIREYLTLGKGVKEDAIDNQLKTLTKTDPNLSHSEKIKKLRDMGAEDGTIASWIKKEYTEGKLTKDEAITLYTEANPKVTTNDAYFKLEQADWEAETGNDVGETDYFRLNDALANGNAADVQKAIKELNEHGYNEKKITEHVVSEIAKAYKEGRKTKKETKEALEKHAGMTDEDIYWKLDRIDYQKETKLDEPPSGNYYRLTDAVNANKAEQIQAAVKELLAHGVTKEKIKGKLSDWKSEYLAADSSGKIRIRDAITKAYKAAGYTSADAQSTIDGWMKEKNKSKTTNKKTTTNPDTTGQWGRGNINLNKRTVLKNSDGSISTEESFSTNIDGKEVLLPTIINGKRVSERAAIEHYKRTGEHLGKFNTVKEAEEYAQKLHERQDWYYHQ